MKEVSVVLPTYTADVSGVCSALYELGGMVVIHDPSGCNSTYNTHDEPRWYDQESLVFLSGLSETDAILGNDTKFIEDIVRAAKALSPRFVALVRSPVPLLIGTDFPAIRKILEKRLSIPVFYFPTDGMHSYITGAGMALEQVARTMVRDRLEEENVLSVNVLGVTPLDFSVNTTLASMTAWLEKNGCQVGSVFAMGSTPEQITGAGAAHVNVVVSSVGLAAANVLRERFGTPWVAGMPTAPFDTCLLTDIKKSAADKKNRISYLREDLSGPGQALPQEETRPVSLIGEPVTMGSLAAAIEIKYGVETEVICPLEADPVLLAETSGDAKEAGKGNSKDNARGSAGVPCRLSIVTAEGEEAITEAVKHSAAVIADPMYRPICPETMPFFPLPHEAFSGRIYRKDIPDLTDIAFLDAWMAAVYR